MGILARTIIALLAVLCVDVAQATQPLPAPSGAVILRVSGSITHTNRDGVAAFDRAMLEGLGLRRLRTSTAFTDGEKAFEGVLVRDLMERVGMRGATKVTARALNDYMIEIPLSDFARYDVLLALRMDGRDLTARDKGPIWIVYPRDQFRELQDLRYDDRWIWQLNRLEFQ